MPLYDFRCDDCGHAAEVYHAQLQAEPLPWPCPSCVGAKSWVLACPVIRRDSCDYYDEGLGKRITSMTQRRDIMKAGGLFEIGSTTTHGARGTSFSFPGQVASSVEPSGYFARRSTP